MLVSIDTIAAFLRLGLAYDIEELRIEALDRIFYEVPTSLHDYDKIGHGSHISHSPAIWLDALNLAKE